MKDSTPTRCACGAPASVHLVLRPTDRAKACVWVVPVCACHAEAAAAYLWREDVVAAFAREAGLVCGDGVKLVSEGLEVVG